MQIRAKKQGTKAIITMVFEIDNYKEEYGSLRRLKEVLKQNEWLVKHVAEFRKWDEHYNLKLFADSLDATGLAIFRNNYHSTARKDGSRACLAAHMLRRAYVTDTEYSKAMGKLYSKAKLVDVDKGNPWPHHFKVVFPHSVGKFTAEEWLEKYGDYLRKKADKEIKQARKEAWEYINKYIHTWWD